MGLKQTLEAASPLSYRLATVWGSPPYDYYPEIATPPRIYGEEFAGSSQFAVWTTDRINVMALMNQVGWPSWNVARWTLDPVSGAILSHVPTLANGSDSISPPWFDQFYAEIGGSGTMWNWGIHSDAYYQGPVIMDPTTGEFADSSPYPHSSFELPGDITSYGNIQAFAIEREQGRAYVRWNGVGSDVRRVCAYRLARETNTWAYDHDVWAASEIVQIVISDVGAVYVMDANDWIHIYMDSGVYQGSIRNPRTTSYPFGFRYGWDRLYRRLLFLGGSANASDGACTATVKGFYPVALATSLSPALPRRQLRKGTANTVLAHVSGEGGETMSAIPGTLKVGGSVVGTAVSDENGDLIFQYTPEASGSPSAEVDTQ